VSLARTDGAKARAVAPRDIQFYARGLRLVFALASAGAEVAWPLARAGARNRLARSRAKVLRTDADLSSTLVVREKRKLVNYVMSKSRFSNPS
jgi:hypothetical protein